MKKSKPVAEQEYKFKKNRRFPVKAEVAGNELERIRVNRGDLKPDDVVQEARDPKNPLHRCFDWKDTLAAKKWRIYQARKLINSIEVFVKVIPGKPSEPVTAFVHVNKQEQGYQSTYVAMSNEEMRENLLQDALSHLEGVQKRYSHLMELVPVWKVVNKIKEGLKSKHKKAG